MRRFRGVSGSWRRVTCEGTLLLGLSVFAPPLLAADQSSIKSVEVSKPFFNPTIGQDVRINLEVAAPGSLGIVVVDRDGYPVRRLVSGQSVQSGRVGFDWDGKDDSGAIVPDEAYFPKITLQSAGASDVLDPLAAPTQPSESASILAYDRHSGNFTYRLKSPSRVHIQAGQNDPNPQSGSRGPVLRTVVDRQPRAAGKILEPWRGYSADGSILVSELPGFVMAVAAIPLPPDALIAVGNNAVTFYDYALVHRPAPDRQPRVPPKTAGHHEALSVFEDRSPDLSLRLAACSQDEKAREWICPAGPVTLDIAMDETQRLYFSGIAANPILFVDGTRLTAARVDAKANEIQVPAGALATGEHVLAVNWPSWNGPVAVGVARVRVGEPESVGDPHAHAGSE